MKQIKMSRAADDLVTEIPVLPLRDMVVFPHGIHPLFVGTESSIRALEAAMATDKQILLVAKRDADIDAPKRRDLFDVGTIATLLQLLKLPDGTVKALVEGSARARILDFDDAGSFLVADVEVLREPDAPPTSDVLVRSLMNQFEQYVQLSKKVPEEVLSSLSSIDDPGRLVDTIAAQMTLKISDRQRILEVLPIETRLEQILGLLAAEIDLFQVEKRIRGRVKKQMEKSQREYYLNEQIGRAHV